MSKTLLSVLKHTSGDPPLHPVVDVLRRATCCRMHTHTKDLLSPPLTTPESALTNAAVMAR
eukprot:6488481-Amphidinium_carterae.1